MGAPGSGFYYPARYWIYRIEFKQSGLDTGYFCAQDSILFLRLNCLKSSGGFSNVTIFKISLFEK